MTKSIIAFISCLSIVFFAQSQQEFTLSDAIIGSYSKFRPKTKSQLNWIGNENSISWVQKIDTNWVLVKQNIDDKKTSTILSLADLIKKEELKSLKAFPRIKWLDNKTIRFKQKEKTFSYNIENNELKLLFNTPPRAENLDYSPNNKHIAYTYENNLIVNETPVAAGNPKGVVAGQSVHRYEFGISKGTFWSNNGNLLAYYLKDETMVTDYPLSDYSTTPATLNLIKYPMAGMASHNVKIGVWNTSTNQNIWLKTGLPKDQYLTNIAWSSNDKFIYVAILNRDQNELKLNQYDPVTGDFIKTLFEEKHDKYVQPLNPMMFLKDNSGDFIWQSERDGFNNLYLYNAKGELKKQLTQLKIPITKVVQSKTGVKIYYTSADNNGLDRIAYQLNLSTGKVTKITPKSGVHKIKLSADGNYFIDYFTNLTTRLDIDLKNLKGKSIIELENNTNPYQDYNVKLPEISEITTPEGIKLNTRMFKPIDFDASKKYKVLLYVYNGPGVQLITNSWMAGGSPWMAYQANKGYIVFSVDGRGSENRGREFEQAIFRQLGEIEMKDQLLAVDYLSNLNFIDSTKMAVHGWSYGGFMTTSLMLKSPGVFNVGVAGGPVIDWKYYEVMYTERYMDTPQTNPEGFDKASLLDKTKNLKGKLMLIHGADDNVVVPQHSIDLLKQSVDNGVQIDFFIYPGHEHNVRGKDRIHLMEKVLNYIDENID